MAGGVGMAMLSVGDMAPPSMRLERKDSTEWSELLPSVSPSHEIGLPGSSRPRKGLGTGMPVTLSDASSSARAGWYCANALGSKATGSSDLCV